MSDGDVSWCSPRESQAGEYDLTCLASCRYFFELTLFWRFHLQLHLHSYASTESWETLPSAIKTLRCYVLCMSGETQPLLWFELRRFFWKRWVEEPLRSCLIPCLARCAQLGSEEETRWAGSLTKLENHREGINAHFFTCQFVLWGASRVLRDIQNTASVFVDACLTKGGKRNHVPEIWTACARFMHSEWPISRIFDVHTGGVFEGLPPHVAS